MHTTLPQPPSPFLFLFKVFWWSIFQVFPKSQIVFSKVPRSLPPLNLLSPPFTPGCLYNTHTHTHTHTKLPCSPIYSHLTCFLFPLLLSYMFHSQKIASTLCSKLQHVTFFTPSHVHDFLNSFLLSTSTCKTTKKTHELQLNLIIKQGLGS
jgi:hypothetical protein